MTLELDHVIVCVADLETSVGDFESQHGVTSVDGGRHPGHGTANRIIPLGPNYLELLAVVDVDEARLSPLGSWALDQIGVPGGGGVCLRTNDLDSVCRRLRLSATPMSRVNRDGTRLEWRLAGVEQALPANLPFFIQWDIPASLHPGRAEIAHPAGKVELSAVIIFGDHVEDLRRWAPEPLGLRYAPDSGRGMSFRLESTATL